MPNNHLGLCPWSKGRFQLINDKSLSCNSALTEIDHPLLSSPFRLKGTFAFFKMIYGSLPLSSNSNFLICELVAAATATTAFSHPVRGFALIRESSTKPSVEQASFNKRLKIPFGNPASSNTCDIASEHWGRFDACLSIPKLPDIRVGTTNLNTFQNGKFQGITPRRHLLANGLLSPVSYLAKEIPSISLRKNRITRHIFPLPPAIPGSPFPFLGNLAVQAPPFSSTKYPGQSFLISLFGLWRLSTKIQKPAINHLFFRLPQKYLPNILSEL